METSNLIVSFRERVENLLPVEVAIRYLRVHACHILMFGKLILFVCHINFQVLGEDGEVSHFIDGKNETPRNWMCFVNCARNEQEQNLEVFQYGNSIYYRAIKDIPPEQELLVWYGPSYVQFLGIPGIPPITERPRRRRHYEGRKGYLKWLLVCPHLP
jgi:hypothetical protein